MIVNVPMGPKGSTWARCGFLGAKMASYGLVKQKPDAAAAAYTES